LCFVLLRFSHRKKIENGLDQDGMCVRAREDMEGQATKKRKKDQPTAKVREETLPPNWHLLQKVPSDVWFLVCISLNRVAVWLHRITQLTTQGPLFRMHLHHLSHDLGDTLQETLWTHLLDVRNFHPKIHAPHKNVRSQVCTNLNRNDCHVHKSDPGGV